MFGRVVSGETLVCVPCTEPYVSASGDALELSGAIVVVALPGDYHEPVSGVDV